MENKHYTLLVLAMSCNDPFFVESRLVTHDTWAKDIILGSYENIGFYSYTASETGEEYIKDNTIYVNCKDDINNTYDKTLKVFDFLRKNNITFDYILRTNTSIYFNLQLILSEIQQIINDNIDFHACVYNILKDKYQRDIVNAFGFFFVASNKFCYSLLDNRDKYNELTHENVIYTISNSVGEDKLGIDDITISVVSYLLEYDNIASFKRSYRNINFPRYKSILKNKILYNDENLYRYIGESQIARNCTDPEIINFVPFVQYKVITEYTSKYRLVELEHAYELHEANRYVINR